MTRLTENINRHLCIPAVLCTGNKVKSDLGDLKMYVTAAKFSDFSFGGFRAESNRHADQCQNIDEIPS